METVNLQLLAALKGLMPWIDADIERGRRHDTLDPALYQRAFNAKVAILKAEDLLAAEQPDPVAWVRFCSDGCYEGPIMNSDSRMDNTRRTSGAWTPLYAAQPPAVASVQIGSQAPIVLGSDGLHIEGTPSGALKVTCTREHAPAVAVPKWQTCKHLNTKPDWDFVDCLDCGAAKTGISGWKLAKNKWFPSREAAKFYEKHGRMPDEVPGQKGGR